MARFVDEDHAIVQLAVNTTTTAAVNSQKINLKDVKRVTVVGAWDMNPVSPSSAVTLLAATAVANATFSVVVGDATQEASSFAVLTGATVQVGMSTIGQLNGWDAVQISGSGTIATGLTLVIDNVTFKTATDSCVADYNLNCSNATGLMAALASGVSRFLPNYETFGGVTADAGAGLSIRRKEPGPQFNVSVTAAANHDGIAILGLKKVGIIDFTPADVVATNSSYTHFAVRINCTVTGGPRLAAYGIIEANHKATMYSKATI